MEVDEKAVSNSDELNKNEVSEKMDTSTIGPCGEKGIEMETRGLQWLLGFFSSSAFQSYLYWLCYKGI